MAVPPGVTNNITGATLRPRKQLRWTTVESGTPTRRWDSSRSTRTGSGRTSESLVCPWSSMQLRQRLNPSRCASNKVNTRECVSIEALVFLMYMHCSARRRRRTVYFEVASRWLITNIVYYTSSDFVVMRADGGVWSSPSNNLPFAELTRLSSVRREILWTVNSSRHKSHHCQFVYLMNPQTDKIRLA